MFRGEASGTLAGLVGLIKASLFFVQSTFVLCVGRISPECSIKATGLFPEPLRDTYNIKLTDQWGIYHVHYHSNQQKKKNTKYTKYKA